MNYFSAVVAAFLSVPCAWACAADGDLDPSFGLGGMQRFAATAAHGAPAVAVQPDGRIVVCDADRHDFVTDDDVLIERFNADGSLDTTFGVNGSTLLSFDGQSVRDYCSAIALQADGRIVLAGVREFVGFGTTYPYFLVVRITTNGALDTSFAGGAGYTVFSYETFGHGGASAVAVDASGRIVVAGGAQFDGGDEDFAVARLQPDGTFDPAFNGSGTETIGFFSGFSYDYATNVAIDAQDRIVLAGVASGETVVTRLLEDGTADSTFGSAGSAMLPNGPGAVGFLIDHAGRLVIAGTIAAANDNTNADMGVARLFANGSIDTSFGDGGIASVAFDLADGGGGRDNASAIVEQADGKLVIVGNAEYGDLEYTHAAAARLLDDGTLDASFGDGGRTVVDFQLATPADDWFHGAALQDGRVVAVGSAEQGDTQVVVDDVLVRLQSDLVFRETFD
ncbi:MAG TPA: hypothetical protein VGO25_06690 [Rhodanobacteraceae bacterium]|jgi:uncharacterized delta-60 repeat protein|nr:hypothetical protein [Rhodanobacteraceae bacterium]